MTVLVRQELLTAAQDISREKGVPKERVLKAIEEGLAQLAQSKYGKDAHLSAFIDRKTGGIQFYQVRTIVENAADPLTEIALADAQKRNPEASPGSFVKDPLPALDFERIPSHVMRNAITRLIKQVFREKEYTEYKDRAGTIVSGTVKNIDYGQIVLNLGQAEGVLSMPHDTIQRERFRPDDRVRAYVREVVEDPNGFQIFLSRTHPQFLVGLFKQEVPEVYNGTIEIKAVARDPGSKAKIGVLSHDPSLDPVGSCVGVGGSRVQAVTKELGGERIDIVRWSDDLYTFLVNALTPTTVTKIIESEKEGHVKVVVPDDQFSIAIGRGGQNVNLASKITGLYIQIVSETEEAKERTEMTEKLSGLFTADLKLDDVSARLLITEGFEALEDIQEADAAELADILNISGENATALITRATEALDKQQAAKKKAFTDGGGASELLSFHVALTPDRLLKLLDANVKSVKDVAALATDELLEVPGLADMPTTDAESIILKARGLPAQDERDLG